MKTGKDIADKQLIENIKNDYRLSYSDIAIKLNVSKQVISLITTGKRSISKDLLEKLKKEFPIYFTNKPIGNNFQDIYSIKYLKDIKIPECNSLKTNDYESIIFDRKLFRNITVEEISKCVILRLSDDSLKPLYSRLDKIILNTSKTSFIEGYFFAFVYKNQCYIRKIHIMPDKIKCISTNNDEDTFYITENYINEVKILGMILPRFRF